MRPARLFLLIVLICAAGPPVLAEQAHSDASEYPTIDVGGFSDFNFFASNEEDVDSSSGFDQGQLVVHLVSALSSQISFFGELSLTAKDSEYKAELERGFIKFDYSDNFKFSFGRFHTPINRWNTDYHHGQWLQTTVDRPEMTRFGGQFIPVHFVGGIVEGSVPSGSMNLKYQLGVGNGRHDDIARAGDAGDNNNNRAWLVNLGFKPDRPYRLEFGGAFYRDKISFAMMEDFRESILSAYVTWTSETPELIGEYARIDRKGNDSNESFASYAFYGQIAYRLPQWGARFKPYARYEKIDVARGEPVFTTQTDRDGFLVGLRIDVAVLVAVKVEYRHQRSEADPYVDAVFTQISFAF